MNTLSSRGQFSLRLLYYYYIGLGSELLRQLLRVVIFSAGPIVF